MEETEGPFGHFWGPLDVNDFEAKPFFESHLIDNDEFNNVNRSLDNAFDEPTQNGSQEVELKPSIAERRAAKLGFDASMIKGDQVKVSCSQSSPGPSSPVRSPYLTIPPGISPAALLESPVMLPNSQQSPTTGTFQMAHCDNEDSAMNSFSAGTDRESDDVVDSFPMFKTPSDFTQMPCNPNAGDQTSSSSKDHAECTKRNSTDRYTIETTTENQFAAGTASISDRVNMKSSPTDVADYQEPQRRECIKLETGIQPLYETDQKGIPASTKTSNAGDGYCWRKYGQKHVKGSEFPRSYYKCNNSNCQVKKKVERSHDGEITEIIYNGAHNHPKPHPRLSLGGQATSSEMLDSCEVSGSPKLEGWPGWRCYQMMTPSTSSDWMPNGLERTSSVPVLNDICDPSLASQDKSAVLFRNVQTPDNATNIASQNGDDQDGMTQGSASPSDDADGDESEPKRRRRETSSEAYLLSRSTREPRIILQIESEIDVLDDGYRWRKYGQKVVKGNPNPRSYYKCTSAGCPVRKHVERASEDIKSVITTYEGKHNHEVPTTKTMGATSLVHSPPNVSDTNPVMTMPRNPTVSNTEMKVQEFPLHYQMKPPALGNELVRSTLLGDFVSNMKFGVSSIYQMKFPPLQSPLPYSPFMMNSNRREFHPPSFGTPFMHDLPLLNASRASNMAVSGFHSNNHPRPGGLVQSSVGMQQIKENDFRFFKPKEEQMDDNSFETCLATTPDNEKPSSTAFCRAVGNLPSRNAF